MGTRVFVGNFPSSATEDQLCRLRATRDEAASLSIVEAESPVRYRGLGGADAPALVELEPVVSDPQLAPRQAPAALPVWENGTLPGIMAGRRPSPESTSPIWGGFVLRRKA
jgi:hypothetical protein